MTMPEVTIFWPCAETTPPTIQARPITATPGNVFLTSVKRSLLLKAALSAKPSATGKMVTINIDLNIPSALTSIFSPARCSIRSGVNTGARSVVAVVIPTEKATSPLQRKLMMLDDTPPGQHPTRKRPTAAGWGRLKVLATLATPINKP